MALRVVAALCRGSQPLCPSGMGLEMALFHRLLREAGIEPLFSEAEEEHQLLLQTLILQRQAECRELEAWLGCVRPEVRRW